MAGWICILGWTSEVHWCEYLLHAVADAVPAVAEEKNLPHTRWVPKDVMLGKVIAAMVLVDTRYGIWKSIFPLNQQNHSHN